MKKNLKRGLKKFWNKIGKYTWWIVYLIIFGVGVYLIGKPVTSIIKSSIDIWHLQKSIDKDRASIKDDEIFLENLKNREFLEQYARETYFMQRSNEQIYIID